MRFALTSDFYYSVSDSGKQKRTILFSGVAVCKEDNDGSLSVFVGWVIEMAALDDGEKKVRGGAGEL